VGTPAILSWSSGKDGAHALALLRAGDAYDIRGLLTTLDPGGRVAAHGVRERLLDLQAAALGLPCHKIVLPRPCPDAVYESKLREALLPLRAAGIAAVIFADLFLADVRDYRERLLRPLGLEAAFPLWARPTAALAAEMIGSGLRARIVCLDPARLPASLAGHAFDEEFLANLPDGVDPCGEKGEFHTFVTEAPVLAWPVPVVQGRSIERHGLIWTDLRPAGAPSGRGGQA
jgi:uncharacterized protein (TIGR00290 family)